MAQTPLIGRPPWHCFNGDVFVGDGMAAIRTHDREVFEDGKFINVGKEGTGSRGVRDAPLLASIPKDVSSSPTAETTGSKSSIRMENFSINGSNSARPAGFLSTRMTSFTWPITNRIAQGTQV